MKVKTLVLQIMFVLLLFHVSHAASADERKKVLIIHSYHPSMQWTEQCEAGILAVLGDRYEVDSFYMDTKRIDSSRIPEVSENAFRYLQDYDPSLVMLGDDNALRFIGPRLENFDVPVVFFGINNNPRAYFKSLPHNVTGVLERLPIFPWVRRLQWILPNAQKALVLMDGSPTTQSVKSVTFGNRYVVDVNGIMVQYAVSPDWEHWQQAVQSASEFDMLLMSTFHTLRDQTGKHMSVEEVKRWTSANSSVPVFAFQDYVVADDGVVGSLVVYGVSHGRRAGEIVVDILENGVNPKNIPPVMEDDGKLFFNKHQLERFSLTLPESLLRRTEFK